MFFSGRSNRKTTVSIYYRSKTLTVQKFVISMMQRLPVAMPVNINKSRCYISILSIQNLFIRKVRWNFYMFFHFFYFSIFDADISMKWFLSFSIYDPAIFYYIVYHLPYSSPFFRFRIKISVFLRVSTVSTIYSFLPRQAFPVTVQSPVLLLSGFQIPVPELFLP